MMKVEVLQSGATIYDGAWQPVAPRILRSDRMGIEIGGQIKMEMPTGIYTLRVTVKDSGSGHSAEQTIDLELEP